MRMERDEMADMRAMEIQHNRENPMDGRGRGGAYYHEGNVVIPRTKRGSITRLGGPRGMLHPPPAEEPVGGARRRRRPTKKVEAAAEERGSVYSRILKVLHDAGLFDLAAKAALLFIKKRHPELGEHLTGSGFFDTLKRGLASFVKPAMAVASMIPGPVGMMGKVGTIGSRMLGLGAAVEGRKPTKKEAKELGEQMAAEMMEMHGSGMFDTFARGLNQFHSRRAGIGRGQAEDQAIINEDMEGAGFMSDFMSGFKKGFLGVVKPAAAIASVLPGNVGVAGKLGSVGLNLLGLGSYGGNASSSGAYQGEGKRRVIHRRGPLAANDPRRKRAEIVKKVMRERNLPMIKASQYVKQHNLYRPEK